LTTVTHLSGRAFDRPRGELIAFTKFRGMGDCGIFARYGFRNGDPVLTELRVKTTCDGRFIYQVSGNDPPSPTRWLAITAP